jgi:hypothetical protein
MILGESGTGKTTSLRNLNPQNVLLIQSISKPLPFKATGWKMASKECPEGSIFRTDNSKTIVSAMQRTTKPIVVLDDFQYTMSNEFMRRISDKASGASAFEKFNDIARNAWDILMAASSLSEEKRVYILSHTTIDEHGKTKAKTIGKLLDEKITIEGLLSIVLRTAVINDQYVFSTRNNGSDTTKSPLGMFDDEHIPNDLALVDKAITSYYQPAQRPQS